MGLINSWWAHSHWVPLSADISGVACSDMWSCGSVFFHNQAKGWFFSDSAIRSAVWYFNRAIVCRYKRLFYWLRDCRFDWFAVSTYTHPAICSVSRLSVCSVSRYRCHRRPCLIAGVADSAFSVTAGYLISPRGLSVVCKWNAMSEEKDFSVFDMCISIHIVGISGHLFNRSAIHYIDCLSVRSASQPAGSDCSRYRSVIWSDRYAIRLVDRDISMWMGNQCDDRTDTDKFRQITVSLNGCSVEHLHCLIDSQRHWHQAMWATAFAT